TNCPLTDLGGKTCIFSHPVYLFLREFSLQDSRGGSGLLKTDVLFSSVFHLSVAFIPGVDELFL
ncbi:hypothetical protein, partial [Escherichia coli]